uniref:Uncharacterized protein n=1 Tax=Nymphaea colorata TaxID=210225 RepID=A0A5K0Y6L8_9MAGN
MLLKVTHSDITLLCPRYISGYRGRIGAVLLGVWPEFPLGLIVHRQSTCRGAPCLQLISQERSADKGLSRLPNLTMLLPVMAFHRNRARSSGNRARSNGTSQARLVQN